MTKKPKRVRVVECEIYSHKCFSDGQVWWEWKTNMYELDPQVCWPVRGTANTRRSAIADARRWWAQFGVKVKIARAK